MAAAGGTFVRNLPKIVSFAAYFEILVFVGV